MSSETATMPPRTRSNMAASDPLAAGRVGGQQTEEAETDDKEDEIEHGELRMLWWKTAVLRSAGNRPAQHGAACLRLRCLGTGPSSLHCL
jgi:hypothetical protein